MPEYLIIPGPMPTVRMIDDFPKPISASPENPPELGDVSSSGIGFQRSKTDDPCDMSPDHQIV